MTDKTIDNVKKFNSAAGGLHRRAGFEQGAKQVVDFVAAFRAVGLNLGAVDKIASGQNEK